MEAIIKEIVLCKSKKEEKLKKLEELENEIKIAKSIVNGEFRYCKTCDDYYLKDSFLPKVEKKKEKICVYHDPINSGGNEYRDGVVEISYDLCPKGHRCNEQRREYSKF